MYRYVLVIVIPFITAACTGTPPRTAERVDLGRYAGRWHEVAAIPQWFQKGCTATTAEYTPRGDGRLDVVNRCHNRAPDGPVREARGTARVVDPTTNAKLKVMFQWPFEGDYWILRLAEDYSAAAVGSPDRRSLWILSRSPEMDRKLLERWVDELKAEGFPVNRLMLTQQK